MKKICGNCEHFCIDTWSRTRCEHFLKRKWSRKLDAPPAGVSLQILFDSSACFDFKEKRHEANAAC